MRGGRPHGPSRDRPFRRSGGHALAGVSAVFDIDLFVVGGGFSHAAADYTKIIQDTARQLAILPAIHNIRVTRAAVGRTSR